MEKDTKIVLSAVLLLLFTMASFSFFDVTNNGITGNAKGISRFKSCTSSDWSCTDLSPETCPSSGIQTRTCTKTINCLEDAGKPSETQSCTYVAPTPQQLCDAATQELTNLQAAKRQKQSDLDKAKDTWTTAQRIFSDKFKKCNSLRSQWNNCGRSPKCFRSWGIPLNACDANKQQIMTESDQAHLAFTRIGNELTRIQSSLDTAQRNKDNTCQSGDAKAFVSSRKETLLKLIETDPDKALQFPELSSSLKSSLSQTGLDQNVEKRGEFTGQIEVLHADDFENPENSKFETYLKLDNDNTKYKLFASEKIPTMLSGTKVSVQGLALENKMAIFSSEVNKLQNFAPPPNENLGVQETLVIIAKINNELPKIQDYETTLESVFKMIFVNINKFGIERQSQNKATLSGRVIGPLNLGSVCDEDQILSKSILEAYNNGYADYFKDVNRIIILSPGTTCTEGFGGSGTLGKVSIQLPDGRIKSASVSWVFTQHSRGILGSKFIVPIRSWIIEHELGHNFGVAHANQYECKMNGQIAPFSNECQSKEYRSEFSVMGYSRAGGNFNAPELYTIGWLDDSNLLTIDEGIGEGTYTLGAIHSPGVIPMLGSYPVKLIRIPIKDQSFYKGKESIYYSLEFRRTSYENPKEGFVLLHIARIAKNKQPLKTNLISSSIPIKILNVGNSYIDEINDYKIKFDLISDNGAEVTIKRISPSKVSAGIQTAPANVPNPLSSEAPPGGFGVSPPEALEPTPSTTPFDAGVYTSVIDSGVPFSWAFPNPTITVTVKVKNIGSQTWNKLNGVKLMWKGPQPNPWGTSNVIELDPTESVSPGQDKTFSFTITKPNSLSPSKLSFCGGGYIIGGFNFEWQMYKEGVGFFGSEFVRQICV